MPVCDVTEELINGVMLFLEQGSYPVDATDDMKPLGCEKWVKEGIATIPAPYQMLEPMVAMGASNIEVGFMSQNILLAESALGLGGWPFGGFTAMMVLGGTPICRGLGFRFETAQHGPSAGFPYPVGKDEVFETHQPHYFGGSIDDAVDDVIERKWGTQGVFNPANADGAPYKNPGQIEQGIPKTDPAVIQCTKDILNAVEKKWGRFPAFVDPCVMTLMVQAHHLECDFEMNVESQAGKFVLSFEQMEPGDGEIVITGKMGVWAATTHMSLPELLGVLRLALTPRMIAFLIKSLFSGRFRAPAEDTK
jgi:hypothetical protein